MVEKKKQTKKLEVVMLDPSSLIPYHRNNRAHSKEHIRQVADSLRAFGFNAPVVVDSNRVIIVGHARREAAILLSLKEIPVVIKNDISEVEAAQYRLVDNHTSNTASMDYENTIAELSMLKGMGCDLSSHKLEGMFLSMSEALAEGLVSPPGPDDSDGDPFTDESHQITWTIKAPAVIAEDVGAELSAVASSYDGVTIKKKG
jgi:hypothetical protein